MRRAAAQVGRDAEHLLVAHGGRVRRCQIVRDQNLRLSQAAQRFRLLALQIPNDPAGYILDIEGALAQIGIVDPAERFGIFCRYFLKDPLDVAQVGLQFAQHLVD